MVTHDARSRISRPHNARARVARTRCEPQPGDIVRVWRSRDRKRKKEPGYIGPCIVILCEGSAVRVSRRGELWKCDRAQIQQCSRKETLSAQAVSQLLLRARERLKYDPEKLGFQDVSREDFPDPDQEGEDLEPETADTASRDDVDMGCDGAPPALSPPAPEPTRAPAVPTRSSGPVPVQGGDSIVAGPLPEAGVAVPEPPEIGEPEESPSPDLPVPIASEEDIAEDVEVRSSSSTPPPPLVPAFQRPAPAEAIATSTAAAPQQSDIRPAPESRTTSSVTRRLDFDNQDAESRSLEPPSKLSRNP